MVPIDSPGSVSYLASVDPIVVSVTIFRYLTLRLFFHMMQA